jgi:hypothetical protein
LYAPAPPPPAYVTDDPVIEFAVPAPPEPDAPFDVPLAPTAEDPPPPPDGKFVDIDATPLPPANP